VMKFVKNNALKYVLLRSIITKELPFG